MGSPNGGIVGVINPTSFGKCTVTSATGSTTLTTQPGTRLVSYAVVAGGGGGGSNHGGAGGAGGLRTCTSLSVCGATPYPITVGSGGAAGVRTPYSNAVSGTPSIFSSITSAGGGGAGSRNDCSAPCSVDYQVVQVEVEVHHLLLELQEQVILRQ